MHALKTAIDVGGTFTDVMTLDAAGAMTTVKLPTTPDNPAAGFRAGIAATRGRAAESGAAPQELLYSTTLAVNALLAHRLPRIGLVVTAGFREILETARLPALADTAPAQAAAPRLVPLELVREVSARIDARGGERRALDTAEVGAIAAAYRDAGVGVVAVSLLHSYLDDAHERAVGRVFAQVAPAIRVVLSCTVLPELREYERTVAAALNACLIPIMGTHIDTLGVDGAASPLLLMKSSGGLSSAAVAAARPLATALSGPSAAVVGMAWLGRSIGYRDLITLDIGGTSTDVALVRDGRYALTTSGEIAGFPFKTPMIDVLTIGAGGGSLATQGPDTRWHVGPASAGAVPGPVCYGRGGTQVTLTDAQLALGRLPAALLGGALPLDVDAARDALERFGRARGLNADDTARGLLAIASHNMCGAIRRVSVQRGYDPADYALLAMGGAGPLHAVELAALLGIGTVIVPPQPGLAAAFGLLVADIEEDFVQVCGLRDDALDGARAARDFAALEQRAIAFLTAEGVDPDARRLQRRLDIRYAGMSGHSTIALSAEPVSAMVLAQGIDAFHAHHQAVTGHDYRGREAVELVNLRVTATGLRAKPTLPAPPARRAAAVRGSRPIAFLGHRGFVDSAVYDRDSLACGSSRTGPAVIEQYESTIIIPPGYTAVIDDYGNVIIRPEAAGE